jgi:predicted Zn-dependent protease
MGTRRCLAILVLAALLSACQSVPLTGREQLHLISSQQMNALSLQAYDQFLSENEAVTGTAAAREVKEVGSRIAGAVERYMSEHGMADRLKGYKWEFNLVKNSEANAWAMPGGKVVVYTGILPIAKNENGLAGGLAVVMGHEIAHAIANHGNERMSQALLTQMGGVALSAALASKPAETQQLFLAAFGLGAQVGVLLPYSRLQESEADHLGLIFMAMACYDPHAAVDFWERMMKEKQGGATPEFLSTHPSDRKRIQDLKSVMPEAMRYYKRSCAK